MLITAKECFQQTMKNKDKYFLNAVSGYIEEIVESYGKIEKAIENCEHTAQVNTYISYFVKRYFQDKGFKVSRNSGCEFGGAYTLISWRKPK